MKKTVFCLIAFGLLLLPAKAQTFRELHPNEISLGYSMSLLDKGIGLINKAHLGNTDPDTGEFVGIASGGSAGIASLSYARQMNPYVALGASFGFNRVSLNMKGLDDPFTLGSSNIYSAMVIGKFEWFHTQADHLTMYSKLGLGAMLVHGSVLEGLFAGHLVLPTAHCSFIGLEAGKTVSGFLELGVGFQGIAQLGVRVRF